MLRRKDPIKWRRSNLVITTKIFWGPSGATGPSPFDTAENELGVSRKHVMEGVDAALKRLQLDYVDVVYAHRNDPVTPLLEQVRAAGGVNLSIVTESQAGGGQ